MYILHLALKSDQLTAPHRSDFGVNELYVIVIDFQ